MTTKKMKNTEKEKTPFKTLNIEGTKYKTILTKKFTAREKWEEPDLSLIYSYIPGTIIKLYVKEGQKVKAGQRLLVLEAMKMRNLIHVPLDGIIKKINVEEGEKIPKGHIMVELEFED